MSSVIGVDLIWLLREQSDLYHSRSVQKWKVLPGTLKWSNIMPEEMTKFLGLIILMGQVREENTWYYWSTDPTISTPIFPHSMTRNCFEYICQVWHFSENSQQTWNSGKITKCGVLVRMVCEVVSGYIWNMMIYSAEGKNLKDTVLSLSDRNLGQNYHIYQFSVYNSVRLSQTLLDRNVRVWGTMRANGHFMWPRMGRQMLEKGQSAF